MNSTLERFWHSNFVIKKFDHLVVHINLGPTTPLSGIIAGHVKVRNFGELSPLTGAKLPLETPGFETTVKRIAPAEKLNYLALMMINPNPHFHAIPPYTALLNLSGASYRDITFFRPADVLCGLKVGAATLKELQDLLSAHWKGSA